MMTPDQIIEVVTAFKEGRGIEVSFRDNENRDWFQVSDPKWNFQDYEYRTLPYQPKPKKWRAWTPEEVPVGALWRPLGNNSCRTVIASVSRDGTIYLGERWNSISKLLEDHDEHSIDNGQTWLPCGVEE